MCIIIIYLYKEKNIQMKYSDYEIYQFSPMYQEVAQKLLTLAKDDETKRKIERNIK